MKSVAIIGLGYVGLPLAVQAAEKGYEVHGIDLNVDLLSKVERRISPYINDPRFASALKKTPRNSLKTGTDYSRVSDVDVVVICVPTPTRNNVPDLSYISGAVTSIAPHVKKGQIVILESTVNPGVTRNIVAPILTSSGLTIGSDIFLAHCPERVDPGNKKLFVGNLNRVIGGITPSCTRKAALFYRSIIDADIVELDSCEEAEFTKSWENSHRNAMIALANEAAIICDALGMDIGNILHGLQSKIDQFGLSLAKPGIGPGGHCIPEDIHYVIQRAHSEGVNTKILEEAAALNESMPAYGVQRLENLVRANGETLKEITVGLLGLSYKENISDIRRSPGIKAAQILQTKTNLLIHDPHVSEDALQTHLPESQKVDSLTDILNQSDAIFIATAHDEYINRIQIKEVANSNVRFILDGRNCIDHKEFAKAGILYRGIGR